MRRPIIALSAVALLAGCASAPGGGQTSSTGTTVGASQSSSANPTPTVSGADYKACLIAESAGLEDTGVNQAVKAGLDKASKNTGISVETAVASDEGSYASTVEEQAGKGCQLVTVIGHGDAAIAAATAHSDVNFLVVGAQPTTALPNLKGLIFDASGAAFLAGYLAAAQSASGTVATFGGSQDPDTVTAMDGFVGGVAHHNQVKGTSVKALGWDSTTQQGSILPGNDAAAARTVTEEFVSQGADVVYPVAGQASTGALEVAQKSGGKLAVIWDGFDGCETTNACPVILTSVVDNITDVVADLVTKATTGTFESATTTATMESGGVVLAPYHDFDSKVSQETKEEIEKLRAGVQANPQRPSAAG